ncbi:hypothetical protein KGF57_005215 [Candida theae]|uniref:TMEM205-like domain-containing protein n=1 Tax=Candida theae TaxID=1198502 RepID=A0AAD5B9G6_9ASCO|nr:uncharacterized protein KGF57_005215 [Candida theae]KAI5948817.1 hypothetical protein KGF57_005215 [Candida theae]
MSSIINQLGLNTRVPYHFLYYSLSFGGIAFYSYVASPIMNKKLTKEEYGKVQSSVFPCYFGFQTVSPILLAAITPFKFCPFKAALLAIASIAGCLNLFLFKPKCHAFKEGEDNLEATGKDKKVDSTPTEEMQALSKCFSRCHLLSSIVNGLSIISLAVYGLTIARGLSKIKY